MIIDISFTSIASNFLATADERKALYKVNKPKEIL